MNIRPAVALLALLLAPPADAATYKCNIDGKVAYQDKPCPKGTGETVKLQADPGAARRAAVLPRDQLVPRLVQIENEQGDIERKLEKGRAALAAKLGELNARGSGVDAAAKTAVQSDAERARREWSLEESNLTRRLGVITSEEEAIRARLANPDE